MRSSDKLPLVFCFGGQGSQYRHMASELFQGNDVFRRWMTIGDEVVRERHGFSVIRAIYDPARSRAEPFADLEETHPAIFIVQYALAKLLLSHGVEPDRLFGVSLGEITSLAVSGIATFEPVLRAVSDQPGVYRDICVRGGMTAVLGSPALHGELRLLETESEVAGVNSDAHFVLSAPVAGLNAVERELRNRDIAIHRLPVPFAFHSRWVEPAAERCRALFGFTIREGRYPCWSSRAKGPIEAVSADTIWESIRGPMYVRDTVRKMEAEGGALYLDLSPSGTIAAILPQIFEKDSRSRALSILSPFGGEEKRLAAVLDAIA